MFTAAQMPTFATVVGVAPSTTTIELGAPVLPKVAAGRAFTRTPSALLSPSAPRKQRATPSSGSPQRPRYYMPYASLEDLRSSGLGIVNESDAWLTGRPYGLPGTATVRLNQRPGGYRSPMGYHYDASMVGGGFGDADTQALTAQVQQLIAVQQAQEKSLKRVAFWQMLTGGILVGSLALGTALGIASAVRGRRGGY